MSSRRVPFLLLSAFAALAACSSDPDAPSATTDSGLDAKVDTGKPVVEPCSEPIAERPAGSVCVKTVTGKAVDGDGAPLPPKKLVSVCGRICYFGQTGEGGVFTATVGKFLKVSDFAVSVHGRPEYASLYEKLAAPVDDVITVPTLVLPKLPPTGERIPMDAKGVVAAATTVTNNGVTLSFQAGTTVELDLEDVDSISKGEPGDHFRALKIADKDQPSFVKGANVVLLYAAMPFDSKYDKKVAVSIAETAGLADGTVVEFIALGNDFLREPFSAGKLEVVGTGKVTGGKIVTDDGQGLSTLTWLGVRKK
ncbi:MAG: hypothetical protein HYV09_21615 [Deltaproteobacteria bacterium]|nr:hypothetical protein [Deltaproteobacteria bacterium]